MWHGFVERAMSWLAAHKLVRLGTNPEDITTLKARKDNGEEFGVSRQQYLFDWSWQAKVCAHGNFMAA